MRDLERQYLALGDSMSIDKYTEVEGGGAVKQFFRGLGDGWTLTDWTFDGATMPTIPDRIEKDSDLVTLTIGGNDLLTKQDFYLAEGLDLFGKEHLELLMMIRDKNPSAILIVGNVYHPQSELSPEQDRALTEANRLIEANIANAKAILADIHGAFLGRESEYLCLEIEPTLAGARAIARLFGDAYRSMID